MGFELYILSSFRSTHIESILFNKGTDFRGELWLLVRDDYLRTLFVETLDTLATFQAMERALATPHTRITLFDNIK